MTVDQEGDASEVDPSAVRDSLGALPAKHAFYPMAVAYLNSAAVHPFSRGARRAVMRYLRARGLEEGRPAIDAVGERVRSKFAKLINAHANEVCVVPSTTAGEHLVLQALGIPACGGRIVTDTLHFPGSFYLYEEMAKSGMDVVWLKPRDGVSIDLADVEAAITPTTRLVAVSLVSSVNGAQCDLKRICAIAHGRGALVYADIVQGAGAVPVDIKESNVDFAACASYKWLMGDFGVGLLYVREDILGRVSRTQFGFAQLKTMQTHVYPLDAPGSAVATYLVRRDASGHFATGTVAGAGLIQLAYSLDYIQQIGVSNIQRHRQPMLEYARTELERRGYRCMTPLGATSPILTFVYPDAYKLETLLDAAKVDITLVGNRLRISPSVFNDFRDIERLLDALP